MPRKTPAQRFADIFARFINGATPGERQAAEGRMDAWLKRNQKSRADVSSILAQAAADDAAANPPPPSDPRDGAPHPLDSLEFTPAGLVEGILKKYLALKPHVSIIYSLWLCFTHVYTQFAIAPRVALISEGPDSGKTTAEEIGRHLVHRPNPETLGTGAAIEEFLAQGLGTVLLDELDQVDAGARRRLQQVWNIGYRRGAKISLKVGGRRKLIGVYAPMLAAGVGSFLAPTQKSRTFSLEMAPYTAETRPEREYDSENVEDLNAIYSYLRHWAAKVKLDPKPPMPAGMIRRLADNARGLLSVADSCGPEWGQRARDAIMVLVAKERAERPEITMLRHGLAIFDALGLEEIGSVRFNRELRQLDLPDARWTRYRGPSGTEYAHPIEMHEQAQELAKVGIRSVRIRPPGERQCNGYKLAQFEDARQKHGPDEASPARGRLRLITPRSD